MKKKIVLLATFICFNISCYAQTGINTKDSKATIQIKEINSATFADGIITPQLSRSELTSKDNVYTPNHKSTLVYVTSIDGTVSTKTEHVNRIGYYVFNGNQWKAAEERIKFFMLPAFTLKLDPNTSTTTGLTFDIYNDVYKKQLTNQGGGVFSSNNINLESTLNEIYDADELDYVITYFDTEVLENITISTNGVMTYDVKNFDLSLNSFINIVLVIK